jgi:hypothetical protein
MRKFFATLVVLGLGYFAYEKFGPSPRAGPHAAAAGSVIAEAYANRRSDVLVEGSGEVIRILADDTDGGRHQRFILRLASGQTLLVAHNIDLAPRVAQLKVGDSVEFSGEYEWKDQGGVIHWTHKDPRGQHRAGWLRFHGETYQ